LLTAELWLVLTLADSVWLMPYPLFMVAPMAVGFLLSQVMLISAEDEA